MSALFNFSSFVVVLLLTICTCAFVKGKGARRPSAAGRLGVPAPATALLPHCTQSHAPRRLHATAAPSLLSERTG